jgi:hypothetical protein
MRKFEITVATGAFYKVLIVKLMSNITILIGFGPKTENNPSQQNNLIEFVVIIIN